MEKIVTAVVGCGKLAGNVHLPNLAENPAVELRYAVDIEPERAKAACEKCGMRAWFTDYRRIFEDKDVRAVMVITSNYAHYEISTDCLNHGLDVFCEKPATVNYELSLKMAEAAARSGRVLEIGVCNRYNRTVELISEMIGRGELGDIYSVFCSFRAFRSIPGLGGEFTTRSISGGGVLIDWGVHFLDLILYALRFPQIRTVTADCSGRLGRDIKNYVYKDMWAGPPDYDGVFDVEDFVSGHVRTDGASVTFIGAWAQNIGKEEMYIDFMGDKGGVRMDYYGGYTLYRPGRGVLETVAADFNRPPMHRQETEAFFNGLMTGKRTRNHIDSVLGSMKLLDAIYRSCEAHREIVIV